MAAIYLIRHGQASFGQADYDQLSEKGEKQAQMLGQHWQALELPGKVFAGNLHRHEQTRDHFLSGLKQDNLPVASHTGFNEFNHVDVLIRYKPQWQNQDVMQADLAQHSDPKKALYLVFEQAIFRWMSGDYQDQYQESWQQFKQRCVGALNELIYQELAHESGKACVVFTSGGPISVIIQHVLALDDQQALAINRQLKNTGVTKLLFSAERLSIDYFNSYSHLSVAGNHWVSSL